MSYPITFTSHTRSHIQEKYIQGLLCFVIVDFAGFFCLFLIQDCKNKTKQKNTPHSHTQEKQLDCASEKKKKHFERLLFHSTTISLGNNPEMLWLNGVFHSVWQF